MRIGRPSLWRAPLQALALQQQQVKVFLSPLEPQEQAEGDTVTLVGQDGQPHLYEMLTVTSGGDVPAGIIYRPGGVSKDNVLATAKEVKQAIADTNGAVVVFVDASLAPTPGTALWPDTGTGASIGQTDCLGTVEFRAYGNIGTTSPGPGGQTILRIKDGASFRNLRKVGSGITLQGECTTTKALSFSASSLFDVVGDNIGGGMAIVERLVGATVPMVEVGGAEGTLGMYTYAAFVENDDPGAVGFFKLDAAAVLTWLAAGGLLVETVSGGGGPIVTSVDGTSTFLFDQLDPLTIMPNASSGWLTGFTGTQRIGVAMSSPQSERWDTIWYDATDIYWDPVAGDDSNGGLDSGHPVQHFSEIVRRYGSDSPILPFGQSVTIHQLSAQTAGQDPVYFAPRLSGGGQAVLLVTLQVLQAAFVGGVVTPRVIGAPGTRLQVAGLTGAAAKQYVFNQTRNSYASIDSVAVGVATMGQPLTAASVAVPATGTPAPTEDNTWATGDTYIIYQRQLTNLIAWDPVGADISAGNKQSCGWVQWARIPDAQGSANDRTPHTCRTCFTTLSDCQVDGTIVCSTRAGSYQLIGGDYTGNVRAVAGNGTHSGGIYRAGLNHFAGTLTWQAGIVLHSNVNIKTPGIFTTGDVFSDGTWNIGNSGAGELYWSGQIWGSFSVVLSAASACINASGGAWAANFLTSGTLKFATLTTGTPPSVGGTFTLNGVTQVDVAPAGGQHFPANAKILWSLATVGGTPGTQSPYFSAAQAADAFHVKSPTAGANDIYNWQARDGSVSITLANLDTYNGLYDEATGARYCNLT